MKFWTARNRTTILNEFIYPAGIRIMKAPFVSLAVITLCIFTFSSSAEEIMDSSALATFPNPPADHVIAYGEGALQFGELRLPEGAGPHPVMVLVHGGCWLAEFDIAHIRKLAAAFTAEGIATWTLEYRRVGNPGGGWPGTFDDVANGTDHLVSLAEQFDLDLNRVIVAGHSAGGHLAIWLGNRPDEWPAEIQVKGVVALAPAADLAYLHETGACDNVVDRLMGGSPVDYPDRYGLASATARLPLGIPQYVVLGEHDMDWSPVGHLYIEAARSAGDDPNVTIAGESGHFEMIDPDSSTWPLVLKAVNAAINGNP
jgi:acetyl esterase/lipase